MLVKDLIKELQNYNQDLPIRIARFTGETTVTLAGVTPSTVRANKKFTPTIGSDALPLPTDECVVVLNGANL